MSEKQKDVNKTVGGFFALALSSTSSVVPSGSSVLDFWGVNDSNSVAFQNARSALRYIFNHHQPKRIWAPAFICSDAVAAVPGGTPLSYYPVQPNLSPDVSWLGTRLEAGDCVLAVDYFGCPPDVDFIAYTQSRLDVLWVEDCAQALDPAHPAWGNWAVYSPRKLFGVPDGGIAVRIRAKDAATPVAAEYDAAEDASCGSAALLKLETESVEERDAAYQAYRDSEAAMQVCATPMSCLTRRLLALIDARTAIARRRKNYGVLVDTLRDFAVLPHATPSFAPLGFPVRHRECDRIWTQLRDRGVFAARHWRDLPSPAAAFPWEHTLSEEIMTLPCDQRYDAADMQFVAEMFREALE